MLGLDLSLTGLGMVVLGPEGEVVFHETVGVKLGRGASVRDKTERLLYLSGRVVDVVKSHEPDAVVIEDYAYGVKFGATFDLGELGGVVKTNLWLRCKIEPVMVGSGAARKAVLGNGRPKKAEIIPMLKKKGVVFKDHNQADAYVVAEWLRVTNKDEEEQR